MMLLALALLVQDGPARVAGDANQPHLAADKDGVFYCVFIKGGNIQLSTSADNGKTWSEPVVAIDAKGKARGGMQRGPRVGVDDKKRIFVTAPLSFDPAEESKKYPTAELWLAVSEDGKMFAKPVQVNEVPKKAPESLHWLAVSPDGAAHIVWLDMRDQKRGQDLFYAKWTDGKLGKNVKIGATICECCAPGIGVDAKGNPTVAFREGGSKQNRSIFVTRSTDGGKTWKAPAQINQGETKVPN